MWQQGTPVTTGQLWSHERLSANSTAFRFTRALFDGLPKSGTSAIVFSSSKNRMRACLMREACSRGRSIRFMSRAGMEDSQSAALALLFSKRHFMFSTNASNAAQVWSFRTFEFALFPDSE